MSMVETQMAERASAEHKQLAQDNLVRAKLGALVKRKGANKLDELIKRWGKAGRIDKDTFAVEVWLTQHTEADDCGHILLALGRPTAHHAFGVSWVCCAQVSNMGLVAPKPQIALLFDEIYANASVENLGMPDLPPNEVSAGMVRLQAEAERLAGIIKTASRAASDSERRARAAQMAWKQDVFDAEQEQADEAQRLLSEAKAKELEKEAARVAKLAAAAEVEAAEIEKKKAFEERVKMKRRASVTPS